MNEKHAHGLALLCDAQGLIQQVLRNDLDLAEALPGQTFFRIVDSASRAKALNFLTEVKAQGALLDWEMNVPGRNGVVTLHFAAGQAGDLLLITASTNGTLAARLYEDMLRINNEQMDMLRLALKDNAGTSRREPDLSQYDEISRLNNELVSMQRELARKNAELARLNELKNQFLGMAAHDLRNPLQGILSYSDFLLDELAGELSAEHKEFLTAIRDQSQFMARLVNDLLDVAAIESGKLQLDLSPTDLVHLTQANLSRNRMISARKAIALDLEAAPIPALLLDAAKIEQVLDNLVTNAIKFSPPGSRVQISLRAAETEILLSVKDEGPGIPPDELETLFKPFQRTSVKSSGGEKSTGLGLVIVKRIVEGHGGRIRVESQVGAGSTFSVYLPVTA
ncbi:MAG: HAMP domain-containing sensor histidine kinase [Anaerolineales bacterium]